MIKRRDFFGCSAAALAAPAPARPDPGAGPFVTSGPTSAALRRKASGPHAALMREAADEIDRLRDALFWCGGSPSFGPGGEAEEGWRELVRPLL
jgi:hypothetical protein